MDIQAVMLHKQQGCQSKPAPRKKKWYGKQEACELCNTPFTQVEWFADASCWINGRRTWAVVCPDCHAERTNGKFGTGIGQKYDATTKIKLEG